MSILKRAHTQRSFISRLEGIRQIPEQPRLPAADHHLWGQSRFPSELQLQFPSIHWGRGRQLQLVELQPPSSWRFRRLAVLPWQPRGSRAASGKRRSETTSAAEDHFLEVNPTVVSWSRRWFCSVREFCWTDRLKQEVTSRLSWKIIKFSHQQIGRMSDTIRRHKFHGKDSDTSARLGTTRVRGLFHSVYSRLSTIHSVCSKQQLKKSDIKIKYDMHSFRNVKDPSRVHEKRNNN